MERTHKPTLNTSNHRFYLDEAMQLHITRLDDTDDDDSELLSASDTWELLEWLYDNHRDALLRLYHQAATDGPRTH